MPNTAVSGPPAGDDLEAVRDARNADPVTAGLIGQYWNALHDSLRTPVGCCAGTTCRAHRRVLAAEVQLLMRVQEVRAATLAGGSDASEAADRSGSVRETVDMARVAQAKPAPWRFPQWWIDTVALTGAAAFVALGLAALLQWCHGR